MDKIKEVMGLVARYGAAVSEVDQAAIVKDYLAIEAKLRELLARVPVAHLWQHSDTGRTRVIMEGDVWTSSREWSYVGPLVLGIGNASKGI